METRLDNHQDVHARLDQALAELKDRLFNVLLLVSGSCIMAVLGMGAYVLKGHGF